MVDGVADEIALRDELRDVENIVAAGMWTATEQKVVVAGMDEVVPQAFSGRR